MSIFGSGKRIIKLNKCKIIAEIGWNHMGDMNLAKTMIDVAKGCGADYAKFQTWSVKNLKPGPWDNDGRREIYEKAELTKEKHYELKDYCYRAGITFLTSVFNYDDISMVKGLGCEHIKIPSTEAVNKLLVEKCLSDFSHVFISTGGLTYEEIIELRDILLQHPEEKCTVLHCVSLYPCPLEKANIERVAYLAEKLPCDVGYSDHTQNVWAAYAAIAHGATVVEKHFTVDNSLPGRDNKFACTPEELRDVCRFREVYALMTSDFKRGRQNEENGIEEYRGRWG